MKKESKDSKKNNKEGLFWRMKVELDMKKRQQRKIEI